MAAHALGQAPALSRDHFREWARKAVRASSTGAAGGALDDSASLASLAKAGANATTRSRVDIDVKGFAEVRPLQRGGIGKKMFDNFKRALELERLEHVRDHCTFRLKLVEILE